MKKIIAIPLLIVVVFSFASCCLFYDYECNATDNFDIGYSKLLNQAFLSDYNWDGTEKGMNIVIPEEYKKYLLQPSGVILAEVFLAVLESS